MPAVESITQSWLDALPDRCSIVAGNCGMDQSEFPEHEASSVGAHGLLHAEDGDVFDKARELDAILITKDVDFVTLPKVHGAPPQVVWLTCGNTSNTVLRMILREHMPTIVDLLEKGERLVEVTGS